MKILKQSVPFINGLFVFIVYLVTMAPGVMEIDSGELAAVQLTLGIAHPTGYPLFTILGYLFSLIPLPVTGIIRVNLLSAIYCASTIVVLNFTLINILKWDAKNDNELQSQPNKKDKNKKKSPGSGITPPEILVILISVFASLTLAFSKTFWLQANSTEVYALHILLISLIIFFLIKVIVNINDVNTKYWLFIALLFGSAFSNHMTILLLIPGTFYIYYISEKQRRFNYKLILKSTGLFATTIILLYLYLPVRASFDPALNWGDPGSLDNFIRHISGAQYQVWMFSSIEAAKKQFVNFFATLPSEFSIPVLLISLIGLLTAKKTGKAIYIFTLICFTFTALYSSNYDIKDLETYYLLSYYSITIFVLWGSLKIVKVLIIRKVHTSIILILFMLVSGFQVYSNISDTNRNDIHIYEDYTKALISSAGQNAIIFSYQWDYFLSASYYYQMCEKFREDVIIIDKELLRRSWYYKQLTNNYGNLFKGFENDVNEFLAAVQPFEQDKNFDANKLEYFYKRIMTNLIQFNIDEHPFYIGPELVENEMQKNQFKLPEGYSIVPDLFLFKVVKGNEYEPAPNPDFVIRLPETKNLYTEFIKNIVVKMLLYRTMYEIKFDKLDKAKIYADKILNDFPGFSLPGDIKKKLSL